VRNRPNSGRKLADLIAANRSTVSRVLNDLEICGALKPDGRFKGSAPQLAGLFVSAETPGHVAEILDAAQASDADLRRAMLPTIDARLDGLGSRLAGSHYL